MINAVESALAQDYPNTEIVIVDDASQDETVQILRDRFAGGVRLEVNAANGGSCAAANASVAHSNGSLIKFLHQDDLLGPDCVSKMVACLQEHESVGMVFSRRRVALEADTPAAREWHEKYRELHRGFSSLEPLSPGLRLLREIVVGDLQNWIGEPCCVMVRRECFERLGGLDPQVSQLHDLDHWLRIMTRYDVGFVDEELATYRHSRDSLTASVRRQRKDWLDRLWILETLMSIENVRRSVPEVEPRWRAERRMAFRTVVRHILRSRPDDPPMALWRTYDDPPGSAPVRTFRFDREDLAATAGRPQGVGLGVVRGMIALYAPGLASGHDVILVPRMEKPLRSLYVCYLSLEDPLVHTQVVAYLAGLAATGHTVHLLTFDPELAPARRRAFAEQLRAQGIAWHSLRYHKRPSLPATVYDALAGAAAATRIVRRHRLEAIHARNHVPLASALIARRLTGCRLIFDIRGLMAEEYADAGRWKKGGLAYRLTQRIQRAGLRRADGVVTLTQAVQPYLFGSDGRPRSHVIPCCADLEEIEARLVQRESVRSDLGIEGRTVMIYVGKFTGWYMEREMADFLAAARALEPSLLFLVLTQADRDVIERELARAGVGSQDFLITRANPDEVGRYLAAADFGISFIRRCYSKISSSPTKIGEYLGAGLPVLSSAGIGDLDDLLGGERVGVLVDDFSEAGYERAARDILMMTHDDDIRGRCRSVAHRELGLREVGIPRYDRLYREVAALS